MTSWTPDSPEEFEKLGHLQHTQKKEGDKHKDTQLVQRRTGSQILGKILPRGILASKD